MNTLSSGLLRLIVVGVWGEEADPAETGLLISVVLDLGVVIDVDDDAAPPRGDAEGVLFPRGLLSSALILPGDRLDKMLVLGAWCEISWEESAVVITIETARSNVSFQLITTILRS